MNYGQYNSDEESYKLMDHAIDSGINFFDTANVYGSYKGQTEEIIGRWLTLNGGRREKIVLASKVYGGMSDWINDSKLSAYNIKRACEDSLKRLKTDHIDLYQMHHIDRETPWEEIWQAMEQLIREGKILYVGSSNFAAWNIVEANYKAKEKQMLGLVSEQSIYSLRNRHIELEVVPACKAMGVGIIPWSPMGGGILCGILDKPETGRRSRPALLASAERLRPQIEKYENLCKEINQKPSVVALSWMLMNPAITSPIVGFIRSRLLLPLAGC
jgi:aryl-alcohol dehydrogenase-like predicted oxidoreductase